MKYARDFDSVIKHDLKHRYWAEWDGKGKRRMLIFHGIPVECINHVH